MLGLLDLRQGSGVPPDSGKTVLRSRLGPNYGQLPASELAPRTCLLPKSSAHRIQRLRNRIQPPKPLLESTVIVSEITFGRVV